MNPCCAKVQTELPRLNVGWHHATIGQCGYGQFFLVIHPLDNDQFNGFARGCQRPDRDDLFTNDVWIGGICHVAHRIYGKRFMSKGLWIPICDQRAWEMRLAVSRAPAPITRYRWSWQIERLRSPLRKRRRSRRRVMERMCRRHRSSQGRTEV